MEDPLKLPTDEDPPQKSEQSEATSTSDSTVADNKPEATDVEALIEQSRIEARPLEVPPPPTSSQNEVSQTPEQDERKEEKPPDPEPTKSEENLPGEVSVSESEPENSKSCESVVQNPSEAESLQPETSTVETSKPDDGDLKIVEESRPEPPAPSQPIDEKSSEDNGDGEDVTGSILDRVIKHALQNKLTIGNFDTKKPFDIHRRPGFPAFSNGGNNPNFDSNPGSSSSTEPIGCDKKKGEVSSSGSATTSAPTKCDEEVQPKQCVESNSSSSSIPVVGSSVVTSSANEPIEPPSSSTMTTMSEMSRQELIDSKYKTKEDLKAARTEALLDLCDAQNHEPPHSTSLYVNAPDFSKINRPNPLHVKPPDFQRAANQTQKLQIANPNFLKLRGGDGAEGYYPPPAPAAKTQEQLAELSKTHNYISDLRLKPKDAQSYHLEEPTPHVIHKTQYSIPSTSSTQPPVEPPLPAPRPPAAKETVIYKPKHEMHMQYSKGQYEVVEPVVAQQPKLVTVPKVEAPTVSKIDEAFSLKEKERQLRQEGTIITVKSDTRNDAYRDYPKGLIEKYGNLGPEPKRPESKEAAPKDIYRTPRQDYRVPYPGIEQGLVDSQMHRNTDYRDFRPPVVIPPQPGSTSERLIDPYRPPKMEPARLENYPPKDSGLRMEPYPSVHRPEMPRFEHGSYMIDPRTGQRIEPSREHYPMMHRPEAGTRIDHRVPSPQLQRPDHRSTNPSPHHMDHHSRIIPSPQQMVEQQQHRMDPNAHRMYSTPHRPEQSPHRIETSQPMIDSRGNRIDQSRRMEPSPQRMPDTFNPQQQRIEHQNLHRMDVQHRMNQSPQPMRADNMHPSMHHRINPSPQPPQHQQQQTQHRLNPHAPSPNRINPSPTHMFQQGKEMRIEAPQQQHRPPEMRQPSPADYGHFSRVDRFEEQLRSLSPRSRIIKEQLMHQEMQRYSKDSLKKEPNQYQPYMPPPQPSSEQVYRDYMHHQQPQPPPKQSATPYPKDMYSASPKPSYPKEMYSKEAYAAASYYQKQDPKAPYYAKPSTSVPPPSQQKPHPDLQRELPKDTIMYPVKAPPHNNQFKDGGYAKRPASPQRDYKYKKPTSGMMNPPLGPWPTSSQQSMSSYQSASPNFAHPSPKQTPSPKTVSPVQSPAQFERYDKRYDDKRVEYVDLTRQRYGTNVEQMYPYRPFDRGDYQRPMETIARVEISKPVEREREPERKSNESYKIHVDISAAIKHESSRPYPYPSTSNKEPVQLTVSQVKPEYQVIKTPVISAPPMSGGVKREAPEALDLSIKTVKTKADSTGIEPKRDDHGHTLPRMEFIPNFSKHAPYDPRAAPVMIDRNVRPPDAPRPQPIPMQRQMEPIRMEPARLEPARLEPDPRVFDHRLDPRNMPPDPRYNNTPVMYGSREHQQQAPLQQLHAMDAQRYDPRFLEQRPDLRAENRPEVIRVPQSKPWPEKNDPAAAAAAKSNKNKRLQNHDLERIEDRKYVENLLFNRKAASTSMQYNAAQYAPQPLSPRKRPPESVLPMAAKIPKYDERYPPNIRPESFKLDGMRPLDMPPQQRLADYPAFQKTAPIWHPGPAPEELKREPVIMEAPTLRADQKFSSINVSSGSIGKGADKDVISKLKNSLEQKGQQRLMKKQNSSEMSEEDNKQDIASLLAARIRTKAELKGFHPTPEPNKPKTPVPPPHEIEGTSAFDGLMDWENACDDFMEQLQDKSGKKRGRRKRMGKDEPSKEDIYFDSAAQCSTSLATIPPEVMKFIHQSSSDEDKPLQLLRQQSDNRTEENRSESRSDQKSDPKSMSEKIARNIKSRLGLERKIAARIGNSSSESETEERLRPKKRVRKLRTRSSLGLKEPTSDSSEDEKRKSKHQTADEKATEKDGESKKDDDPKQKEESDTEKKTPSKRKSTRRTTVESEKEETMTRSRKKLEMERKLSNSKVLRNEKIVQNIPVEKKSKNLLEVASKSTTNKQQQTQQQQGGSKLAPTTSPVAKKDDPKRKLDSDSDEDNKNGKNKRKTRKSSKLESSSEEEVTDVLNER